MYGIISFLSNIIYGSFYFFCSWLLAWAFYLLCFLETQHLEFLFSDTLAYAFTQNNSFCSSWLESFVHLFLFILLFK